ncbi:hypothetical protein E2562_030136 [Oryza meyeriana var. granulata]|uniref:Uncharacterized protein n=1 Tax=Oryza meyeriana var. granulata TaxID=110450 RepID=A0A6G1BMR8_9ORYZ|nr:hypothetical protein E2562_030136 [Oryza meyeriana var. granulata]
MDELRRLRVTELRRESQQGHLCMGARGDTAMAIDPDWKMVRPDIGRIEKWLVAAAAAALNTMLHGIAADLSIWRPPLIPKYQSQWELGHGNVIISFQLTVT